MFLGCSFGYGIGLNEGQTISAKLYRELGQTRSVYNFSIPRMGGAYNLYQLYANEELLNLKDVEYVFYVFIPDHIRRNFLYNDFPIIAYPDDINMALPRYRLKNGELEFIKPLTPFYSFSSVKYVQDVLQYRALFDDIKVACDLQMKIFEQMEKRVKELWKGSKFVIIIANEDQFDIFPDYRDEEKKIEDRFDTVIVSDELGVDIDEMKYRTPCNHPRAEVWQKFVPILIKKYGLDK